MLFSSGGVYLACSAARVLPCTRRGVSIRRGLSRAAVTVRKCPGSSPAHRLGQCCGQGGWLLGGTGAAGERGALPRQPPALGDAGRSKGLARGRSVCGCLGQTPGSAVWLGLWHPAVSGLHGLPWGGFRRNHQAGQRDGKVQEGEHGAVALGSLTRAAPAERCLWSPSVLALHTYGRMHTGSW